MKKIIIALVVSLLLGGSLSVSAQTQPQMQTQRIKFYYYPSSNIYYNPISDEYWYYDEPTVKWVEVKTLPTTVTVEKTPVYTVYYRDQDVWKENAMHQKKYKIKKNEVKKKG